MRHLSIDIETYSGVDLRKSGLFKYAQSADFQVLLLAYAYDGGPVELIDLACGESLPKSLQQDLFDPAVIKHAYNAAFEWYCLGRHAGIDSELVRWLPQWRCTMLHGLYCGYTAGLAATGGALGLPPEKLKDRAGSALIRTFCVPRQPDKNGRTRILPHHEPEKWRMFREYCRQDVVTEMEIERRLSAFPVPEDIQAQWVQDQMISLRGVAVDMDLVHGALDLDESIRRRHLREAVELSGLENPNSRDQLKAWLERETGEALADVRKDTVEGLLRTTDDAKVSRMLTLRQQLSKTSIKKYQAMVDTACADNRIRGALQFYGANRTGRWAGRALQPQNLPRTHLPMLDLGRELVKARRLEAVELVYGSVADTLSQLIRTALVAPKGKLLLSADFSAIEARVLSWMAGEQWRQEVFATHGRIYEASASQMFGVPLERIVKGNPEYELRQKGKVAELALGYQGASGALIKMGALDKGLTEEELPEIVQRWRQANRRIVDMWYAVEAAAVSAVQTGRPAAAHRCIFALEGDTAGNVFLTVTLPSGRKLFYVSPHMGVNQWGNPSICYWGVNKRWGVLDTYGGKLTENIVQATARDCLAVALDRVESAGFLVVFHVHDELVCEVDEKTADAALKQVCGLMGTPIPWAPGLLLKAEGYVNRYFRKD